jgi:molybdopterin-guanine dinucleotide biosynthesis protein A
LRNSKKIKRYTEVSAFVLAGGASTRMGKDKALLEFGGVPMLVRMTNMLETVVSAVAVVGPAYRYSSLGLRIIEDKWPSAGPLGGIITALESSSTAWNFICACDLPFVTEDWIGWLISRALNSTVQAIVPKSDQQVEPLAAMYHRDCARKFFTDFERGTRSVRAAVQSVFIEYVTPAQWSGIQHANTVLWNVNTRSDFQEAEATYKKSVQVRRTGGR